jgi:hypothetical protein
MHMAWTSNALLSGGLFRYARVAGDGELRYRYQCIWLPHQKESSSRTLFRFTRLAGDRGVEVQVPVHMAWTSNALLSRTLFRFTRVAGDGELRYRVIQKSI